MSKTPYTKAHAIPASTGFGVDDYCDNYVPEDKVAALELAANGLAAALNDARALCLAWAAHYEHHQGLPEFHPIHAAIIQANESALTAFAALQPSPHDAPRTETHQANEQ